MSSTTTSSSKSGVPNINEIMPLDVLCFFMPALEAAGVRQNLGYKCEERQFFVDKLAELSATISAMPATGETDGQGDDAIVHLHYFTGSADWWITEKDRGCEGDTPEGFQSQMFGFAQLFGDISEGEWGYISLPDLRGIGAELDLYWTPKTMREVKASKS